MQVVAVEVGKERQPVALVLKRFADEVHLFRPEVGEGFIEIIHINRAMPDSRIFQRLRTTVSRGGDNLEH